ncbi:hypothetical protein Tco_0651652 [Tanacetum coccineum]|uniref:Uncharacterized protein n=1 Tax=Tanacetum coccineum TaxID=301880 RepID=A0ABQ4WVN7_9ASTR
MTRSTIKRLKKPLDKTKREFQRLRRAVWRLHQNESLAIARRNLFDDEASSSNNTRTKPPTPLKTLREHYRPNSFGFQTPITLPTEQTGRIINARDILLIQGTYMFQGLRNEDPLCHVKHYLRSQEANECEQNNPAEHVYLSGGEIYDDPSLLRNSETPTPKAPTFAITTRSGVSTQDPPFPAPPQSTSANHTKGETEKEGPEGAEPSIIQEPTPWPFIFYQTSKSSNLPFPSRLKK